MLACKHVIPPLLTNSTDFYQILALVLLHKQIFQTCNAPKQTSKNSFQVFQGQKVEYSWLTNWFTHTETNWTCLKQDWRQNAPETNRLKMFDFRIGLAEHHQGRYPASGGVYRSQNSPNHQMQMICKQECNTNSFSFQMLCAGIQGQNKLVTISMLLHSFCAIIYLSLHYAWCQ